MAENIDDFDTSEYTTTHPLKSKKNAKTFGRLKDECLISYTNLSDFEASCIL